MIIPTPEERGRIMDKVYKQTYSEMRDLGFEHDEASGIAARLNSGYEAITFEPPARIASLKFSKDFVNYIAHLPPIPAIKEFRNFTGWLMGSLRLERLSPEIRSIIQAAGAEHLPDHSGNITVECNHNEAQPLVMKKTFRRKLPGDDRLKQEEQELLDGASMEEIKERRRQRAAGATSPAQAHQLLQDDEDWS